MPEFDSLWASETRASLWNKKDGDKQAELF